MFFCKNYLPRALTLFLILLLTSSSCTHLSNLLFNRTPDFKLGLIIPPGGAKAFSSIGLLKSLEDYNIPIHHIVGTGFGAWIGAMYSKNHSIDEVRWSIHKLQQRGLIKNRRHKVGRSFYKELKNNFSDVTSSILFHCPSLNPLGHVVWSELSDLESKVKTCLFHPSFFDLRSLLRKNTPSAQGIMLAPSSIRESIDFLKSKGVKAILLLNPLSKKSLDPSFNAFEFIIWSELQKALKRVEDPIVIKITPNLQNYSIRDFDQINQIIRAGEVAGIEAVKKLQKKYSSFDLKNSLYENK